MVALKHVLALFPVGTQPDPVVYSQPSAKKDKKGGGGGGVAMYPSWDTGGQNTMAVVARKLGRSGGLGFAQESTKKRINLQARENAELKNMRAAHVRARSRRFDEQCSDGERLSDALPRLRTKKPTSKWYVVVTQGIEIGPDMEEGQVRYLTPADLGVQDIDDAVRLGGHAIWRGVFSAPGGWVVVRDGQTEHSQVWHDSD